MKIRIAAAEDIPEIEELYRQLFAAMAEIQPEFIRPGSQDESFIRMNMESEEADIVSTVSSTAEPQTTRILDLLNISSDISI